MRKGFIEKNLEKCLFEVKGNQGARFDKNISQKFKNPSLKLGPCLESFRVQLSHSII